VFFEERPELTGAVAAQLFTIWTVTTILGAEEAGRGTGTGEALSEENQLTAGELMQIIDIEDDPEG
jgi:hypothetical protein